MIPYEATVIGTSSGGLEALSAILPFLPAETSLPAMVVQHRAADSEHFPATHLDESSSVRVREAEYGEPVRAGTVYIAPAGYHLHVEPDRTLRLSVDAPVHYARPSIDVLFRSAADVFRDRLVGVVLTGANDDGAEGVKYIKRQGGLVLVQDPATAYVDTMPRAALEAVDAIKFCGESGCVKIWAEDNPGESEIRVGVTDNGPGIAPEDLQLIFDRFQQVEGTAKSSTKGFGLGLSIAKELVGLNFGQMNVQSELGSGSTFSFSIPTWNPYELARRHMKRIKGRTEPPTHVTLIVATTEPSVESSVSDDADEFLQHAFRAGDAVIRVSPHKWLVLANCLECHVNVIVDRVQSAWAETNRNRPGGQRMPEISLKPRGTSEVDTQGEETLSRFRWELPSCRSQELHPPIVPADQAHVDPGNDQETDHGEAQSPTHSRRYCDYAQTVNQ